MSDTDKALQRVLQAEADRIELADRERERKDADALKAIQDKVARKRGLK